ncbi:transcriptional regulator, MerR family [Butyrivibrio proteoclasticus]|uniref:Transcriptional regulator, MerR family n=1 Tax=Butyrivibrio proteoclasticus TaxID=43305 RepID=A0A1I5UQD8_9FIRM|nr:MerR family transcriptional regulator [Butyrivibrio proteoclasticus]SFP96856.1 transcriptional regulator, MerR family [Butyrivibrio proteoclasticus]
MTIKEFSNLCGCNPQTIRYYDRMNLLKPVKVDDWTGYRFYDERQALDFVKIKNLQTAGFTIDEIKELLDADNEAIYEAFTKKIKEQEDRLNAMLEIQKSYQSEITEMTKKIEEVRAEIIMRMEDYNPSLEFGIGNATYDHVKGQVDDFFDSIIKNRDYNKLEYIDNDENSEEIKQDLLNDPNLVTCYEKHGWDAVKDFYDEFSDLNDSQEYMLLFELASDKSNWTGFANTILGMLILKNKARKRKLDCKINNSKDGNNHFWLLIRKNDEVGK